MHYRSRISHRFQCKMLKSKFCHSYDMTRWKLPQSPNIAQRVAGIVKPQTPLKNRLDIAQSKMQGQISRLDLVHEDFKKKEKVLFNKVVQSQKRNDRAYAQAYATELHHLRKTSNMIGGAKLAMEQIQMRLGTMSDLGDIVVTLSPCMAMIKNINASVGSFMPQMSSSMQDLAGTLNDILGDASITNTGMMQDQPIGSEAAAILHEAQATLEGNAKNSLPDPPIHTELKNDILQKREVYT